MLEQIWVPYMDPLLVLIIASFRDYCLGTHWDITIGIYVGTDMGSLGGTFDGSNYGKI